MTALRVVELVRRMEQGRTQPFLVRTEDDALYVAKGRTTTRQGLCAEWLCAHLGRALDLPIPPFALLDVSPTLLGVLGAGTVRRLGAWRADATAIARSVAGVRWGACLASRGMALGRP